MRLLHDHYALVQALPSWLGGDNFARRFSLWKKELFDLQVLPYERTKANMVSRCIISAVGDVAIH